MRFKIQICVITCALTFMAIGIKVAGQTGKLPAIQYDPCFVSFCDSVHRLTQIDHCFLARFQHALPGTIEIRYQNQH